MNVRSFALVIAALLVLAAMCVAAEPAPKCAGSCDTCTPPCPKGPEVKIWGSLDSKPKIAYGYEPDTVEIGIGSYKLLELRGPAAGYTLAEREVAIYNRLTEALSQGPINPNMICVGRVRSAPTIYIGPVRFVSVYVRDAAAVNMTQEALAHAWADRLIAVLPRITAATAEIPEEPRPGAMPLPVVGEEAPYEVAVGGTVVFRLRGPDGFESVRARGRAAEAQIVRMLSDGGSEDVVAEVMEVDGDWVVTYAGEQVVTVTAADAEANKTTLESLAKVWAAKLTTVLPKVKGPTGAAP
jgi:hypothetical protein